MQREVHRILLRARFLQQHRIEDRCVVRNFLLSSEFFTPMMAGRSGTVMKFALSILSHPLSASAMPRKARIDAPGALHHIICRGIERRKIFVDDADREEFIRRLTGVVNETQTFCYAWALIPNHFHLLLRTGGAPITTVMQ